MTQIEIDRCIKALSETTSKKQWVKTVFQYKLRIEDNEDVAKAEARAVKQIAYGCNLHMLYALAFPHNGYKWLTDYYKEKYCDDNDTCECIFCEECLLYCYDCGEIIEDDREPYDNGELRCDLCGIDYQNRLCDECGEADCDCEDS